VILSPAYRHGCEEEQLLARLRPVALVAPCRVGCHPGVVGVQPPDIDHVATDLDLPARNPDALIEDDAHFLIVGT